MEEIKNSTKSKMQKSIEKLKSYVLLTLIRLYL